MGQVLRGRFRDRGTWIAIAVVVMAVSTIAVAVVRDRSSLAAATLTLSVISGNVEVVPDGGGPRAAVDGEALAAGATVLTQDMDARAVLTFRDGSTVELEPEASIKIDQLSLGTQGELVVRLEQERGRTWTHVQPLLSPNSRFYIKTSSATAVVRGTSFEVSVQNEGGGAALTRVAVFEGRVDLVAGGKVVPIAAGQSSEVVSGTAPSAARRMTVEGMCVRIEASSAALVTVTDPDGRTAGLTVLGVVSQIPRTIVSGPQTAPQSVDIFAPTAGDWEIGMVPRANGGPFQLRVTTVAGGKIVDMRALAMALSLGDRAVTKVRLDPDGRGGSFGAPVQTTETRAVALPSENTTTAPLPMARLFTPEELDELSPEESAGLALGCVPPEELEGIGDVEPIGSANKGR
jgi:hypothetical protein